MQWQEQIIQFKINHNYISKFKNMSEEKNTNDAGSKNELEIPTTSAVPEGAEPRKRQCTSDGIKIKMGSSGEIAASPPVFVSLEELMKAANDVTNMVLAHEIAFNKGFKFEKAKKPDNSIEKKIEDVMHKAFWDLLRSELAEDPPNYTQAFLLLNEIKTELLQLLLPQHIKIKQQISEVLDIELIKQQALAGTLDFQQYAQYVISVMGKICAPIRDEKIAELTQTSDVVDVFKGILETLELMRLDMANFTIDLMRPQIMASSVEYERRKFADYLKFNEGALPLTKQWLKKHFTTVGDSVQDFSKKVTVVLNNAYLELLEWDLKNNPFPETTVMDDTRLLELGKEYRKLNLAGAILLLTFTQAGQDLCSVSQFKDQLKNHTLTLLENLDKDETKDLKSFLQDVSTQLKQDLVEAVSKYGARVNDLQFSDLSPQIYELANYNHKILILLRQRIRQFLLDTISSQTAEPVKIPTGFSSLQKEVTQIAGVFLRLTSHNRAVYDEYYKNIIQDFSKLSS